VVEIQKSEHKGLSESTVVLSLSLGAIGNRKRVDPHSEIIQTEVDRDFLSVSKALFDAPELEALYRYQRDLKQKVRDLSVPSFMRGGLFLVKIEAVEVLDQKLSAASEEFSGLVKAFADVVEQRKQESKEKLGPAFDEQDFPSYHKVMSAFQIKWNWFALSTPSSLGKISRAFFEHEAKKAEEAFRGAVEHSEALLLSEAKKVVGHMIDRLTPDFSGKPKVFRNSITENLKEFLDSCPFRSLTSNAELEEQFEKMKKLMDGVSPGDLRKIDKLREDVKGGFEQVKASLDNIVVEGAGRFLEVDQ